ncbi:PhoH family protein [Desulfococcus sp.]|uniref:PhoH family protein n=1 Tax=Desulfococcus sp. TaxID=2025834 RepID=UPI00359476B0
MPKKKKLFILDTNVILHDSSCIYHFEKHDLVIPITVIEELDQFKRGNETINIQARMFLRSLDAISTDKIFNGGIPISPDNGRIRIQLEREFHEKLAANFSAHKPDHHILNTAYQLAQEHAPGRVILVTKDVNLRMKAKSIGLMAEDYTSDHVKDLSGLYQGKRIQEKIAESVIDQLYQTPFEIDVSAIDLKEELISNEYIIMRNGRKSALANYNPFTKKIQRVEKISCYGISARNAEQAFALNALVNPEISLVSITGKAGTGKTLLALAAALEKRKLYRQIYIARPTVPLSNKDIGYLPGDIHSKLDPYMQPLYDNLTVIQNQFQQSSPRFGKIRELLDAKKIDIAPLSYIRGRSLVNIFFIVDEAQNLTPHEIKTIITRAGEGTKIVFTGDIYQIDHPYLDAQSNGLSYLIEKMKGQALYAHINLEKGERSSLSETAINLL